MNICLESMNVDSGYTGEWEGENDLLSGALTTFALGALVSGPVIATDQWATSWN